jgi:hypothetical protein
MDINPHLIWDYSFSPEEYQQDSFKCWYIARVLMRGGIHEIRGVGVENIRKYLPQLSIPRRIREFWEWYFKIHPKGGLPRKS